MYLLMHRKMVTKQNYLFVAEGGHGHGDGGGGDGFVFPVGGDGLDLRVELGALLAVEVHVTADGGSGAGEGEEGQGHRDGHVDAHLAHVDLIIFKQEEKQKQNEVMNTFMYQDGGEPLNILRYRYV